MNIRLHDWKHIIDENSPNYVETLEDKLLYHVEPHHYAIIKRKENIVAVVYTNNEGYPLKKSLLNKRVISDDFSKHKDFTDLVYTIEIE